MSRLEQLQKLHDAEPGDPFLTYGIALEHAKAGNYDDALAWLEKTLTLDPLYCYAHFQKGKLLAEVGREHEAAEALRLGIAKANEAGDEHAGWSVNERYTI